MVTYLFLRLIQAFLHCVALEIHGRSLGWEGGGPRPAGGLTVSLASYIRNANHFENRYQKEAAQTEMHTVF